MTSFSGAYGSRYDGNTILLQSGPKQYIFVGPTIYSFKALDEIVEFVSLVGNNDVPYPYAVDAQKKYYLFVEDVVLLPSLLIDEYDDPYQYYYHRSLLTSDEGCIPTKEPTIKYFEGIAEFQIDDDRYTLCYRPFAERDYERLLSRFGSKISIVKKDGQRQLLTKPEYLALHSRFGKWQGFLPLPSTTIMEQ